MTGFRQSSAITALALACCATLAASSWLVAEGDFATFWALRLLALVTAGAVAWAANRRGTLPPLAAPAFVLPLAALMLYSIGPATYLWAIGEAARIIPPGVDPIDYRATPPPTEILFIYYAPAGGGERLVLGFCAVAWLLALIADKLLKPAKSTTPILSPGVAATLSLSCALLYRLSAFELLPPLALLAAAIMVIHAVGRGGRGAVFVIAILTVDVLLLSPAHAKLASLFTIVALGTLFLAAPARLRAGLLAGIVLLPLTAITLVNIQRGIIVSGNIITTMLDTVRWKVVMRQSETLFCLNFASRAGLQGSQGNSPLYFAYALVPRAIWSDKPVLPGGAEFNRPYCGIADMVGHSASITLLGEPLVKAGIPGAATAMALVVGLLSLNLWAWKGGGRTAPVVALALAPALVDFDQNFTMYFAGAIRSGIILTLAALALERAAWRTAPPRRR